MKLSAHPSEYTWSSYRHNALGQANELVIPHLEYRRLGKAAEIRQAAYRQLFKHRIPAVSLAEIRDATNKAWVLGNDLFNLETAVGRVGVRGFWGAGQGIMTQNGCSIPGSYNVAMRPKNRAILPVADSPDG